MFIHTLDRIGRLLIVPSVLFAAGIAGAAAQTVTPQIPYLKEWAASPHGQVKDEAFTHWNDKGEIPTDCAKCHSTSGMRDFLGLDGSAFGQVDSVAKPGEGVACVACHNEAIQNLTEVTFPSGIVIDHAEADTRCMLCHQGRESTVQVNAAIKKSGAGDDAVSDKLAFLNIHYRAAAATRFGTEVKGGYEYAGRKYAGFYVHDQASTLCVDCHDNHTLKVEPEGCVECHRDVTRPEDFKAIRALKKDFDGDGNVKEGIALEIESQHKALLAAVMAYAKNVVGTPVVYDAHAYPYFFTDKNGNGVADKGEAIYPNRYVAWTPRLLRAAYNYQFVAKDPGVYVHNPVYALQLLHDSLQDLGKKVDVAKTERP